MHPLLMDYGKEYNPTPNLAGSSMEPQDFDNEVSLGSDDDDKGPILGDGAFETIVPNQNDLSCSKALEVPKEALLPLRNSGDSFTNHRNLLACCQSLELYHSCFHLSYNSHCSRSPI